MNASVLLAGSIPLPGSGAQAVIAELAERLRDHSWKVFAVSNKPGRLGRLLDTLSAASRRDRQYAVANVDVFSGQAFLLAEVAAWALSRRGVPVILSLHGGGLPNFAERWPRRIRRLFGLAQSVISPSRFLKHSFASLRGDIELLPNPVDFARHDPVNGRVVGPKLVWLRAFHRIYNPLLAVETLALVARQHPRASMTMVGPDKGDGSLRRTERLARKLGVEERLEICPRGVAKELVPEVLSRGEVFLNTASTDNSPVSVIEAMASGLVVVSTNVGGVPDLIENQQNGLLVGPRSPSQMAAAIDSICKADEVSRRLGRAARESARAHDWSSLLPRWEDLLRRTAGLPRRRPTPPADLRAPVQTNTRPHSTVRK